MVHSTVLDDDPAEAAENVHGQDQPRYLELDVLVRRIGPAIHSATKQRKRKSFNAKDTKNNRREEKNFLQLYVVYLFPYHTIDKRSGSCHVPPGVRTRHRVERRRRVRDQHLDEFHLRDQTEHEPARPGDTSHEEPNRLPQRHEPARPKPSPHQEKAPLLVVEARAAAGVRVVTRGAVLRVDALQV